ncbi:S8 family peptidase [Paenibacillus xerothermodurans]|uniref:Peptidase S8 n=1 Tax=Paenibacillus xerothermodurans TaxID=1977292 RepID=A0A2W1NFD3_PAEXE|nr:S8 family peptidase [Paenibacillus xerothermodurans]PZE22684.1 peptidase S8 [Paenibacillus xerothermodurans]
MWKYALSFILVLGLGAVIFTGDGDNDPQPAPLSPDAEMQMKHATMQQDMRVTGELCRQQCSLELQRVLREQGQASSDGKLKGLKMLQVSHPHMEQLIWSSAGEALDRGINVGELDESTRKLAMPELQKAKQAADQGQVYQSAPLQSNGTTYFVVGVPSENRDAAMLGVVKQSIVDSVKDQELRHLRLVTFPEDDRYKIEAVDSATLQERHVRHPEHNQGASHYHVNQVVVRFQNDPSSADLSRIQSDIGSTHPYQKLGYTYVFESDRMAAGDLMNYFQRWNAVYTEPHYLYLPNDTTEDAGSDDIHVADPARSLITPNDALYRRYQWNLPLIDTERGWGVSRGSRNVTVAVVDTGIDLNHSDLTPQLVSGMNVVNTSTPPYDDVGHGTHVAGVIGALVNNNLGVAGMSWYNNIMPVKVLAANGAGTTYAVAQGIIWATDHGADVINLSLGNYAESNFLHDAIRYAYDHDVVLVAASGNDNTDRPGYPAAYPEVLAVAATDAQRNKASFSNYGDYIDVAAPGVTIASTYPNNQYAALSGTSMASPHVAALAGLIRSVNPSLSNEEVMDIMRNTAQDVGLQGRDHYFGYGLVDVEAALRSAAGTDPVTPREQPEDYTWLQRLWDLLQGRFAQ